jgi:predicted DNA-binding protein (UPF0251 family)
MNKYKTDSGIELDLTPEQATQYSKISKLTFLREIKEEKKKVNVRVVEVTPEI